MMDRGLLIALEGIDGSGHSTQAHLLREALEKNYTLSGEEEPIAVVCREPTDGPIGGEIRECLSGRLEVDSETLALMFAADRRDHVENELRPLVEEGKIAILDRYILSSLAYQGVEVEDEKWLSQINSKAPKPDLTFILDVPPQIAISRMEKDRVRSEIFEKEDKLRKVRDRYDELFDSYKKDGQDIHLIDGKSSKDEIHDEIMSLVYQKIEADERLTYEYVNSKLHEFK